MSEDRRSYVYRHRRLDNNEVFYIGVGTTDKAAINSKRPLTKYRRAYTDGNRNNWWLSISKKYGYTVEVLTVSLPNEEAKELEEFLVSIYGRKDLGKGTLCNLTDGGDGSVGYKQSQDTKKLRSEKIKENYFSPKRINYFNSIKSENIHNSIKVINTEDLKIYSSLREAAKNNNISYSHLVSVLKGDSKNFTNLIYLSEYKENIGIAKEDKWKRQLKGKVVHKYNKVIYDSLCSACKKLNLVYTSELYRMNKQNGNFEYYDNYKGDLKELIFSRMIGKDVINTETGEINKVNEICELYNFNPSRLRSMLGGNQKNKTSYEYLKEYLDKKLN